MSSNSDRTLLPTVLGMATIPDDPIGAPNPHQVAEELLAAEPAVLTGALIGYARVSTKDQLLDRQITVLEAAGLHPDLRRQEVGQERRPRRAVEGAGLPAAWRRSTPPRRAGGWCSTCSPRWRSSHDVVTSPAVRAEQSTG